MDFSFYLRLDAIFSNYTHSLNTFLYYACLDLYGVLIF